MKYGLAVAFFCNLCRTVSLRLRVFGFSGLLQYCKPGLSPDWKRLNRSER